MWKKKTEKIDSLSKTERFLMEQQDKQWIELASIAIKTGRKKAKMQNKNTVSLDLLSKTKRLFMEQQGKAMDRTIQYRHYYHFNRQENKTEKMTKMLKNIYRG